MLRHRQPSPRLWVYVAAAFLAGVFFSHLLLPSGSKPTGVSWQELEKRRVENQQMANLDEGQKGIAGTGSHKKRTACSNRRPGELPVSEKHGFVSCKSRSQLPLTIPLLSWIDSIFLSITLSQEMAVCALRLSYICIHLSSNHSPAHEDSLHRNQICKQTPSPAHDCSETRLSGRDRMQTGFHKPTAKQAYNYRMRREAPPQDLVP